MVIVSPLPDVSIPSPPSILIVEATGFAVPESVIKLAAVPIPADISIVPGP